VDRSGDIGGLEIGAKEGGGGEGGGGEGKKILLIIFFSTFVGQYWFLPERHFLSWPTCPAFSQLEQLLPMLQIKRDERE
jgi:hypothetical protein